MSKTKRAGPWESRPEWVPGMMGRPWNPLEPRYGKLTVVRRINADYAEVSCDCGSPNKSVPVAGLRTGTKSCGCLISPSDRTKTHGMSKTLIYKVWKAMRRRCNCPQDKTYKNYGARGIRVCPRWDDFTAFYEDMGEAPDGMTLDRIDVNGNYEPANVRWATNKQQANNKRNNNVIEFNGVRKTLIEWERSTGISSDLIRARIRRLGWSVEKALTVGVGNG